MKKTICFISLIALILGVLAGCAEPREKDRESVILYETENFKITDSMAVYMYMDIYYRYYSAYGEFAQYFMKSDVTYLIGAKTLLTRCEAAREAGYELTESELDEIEKKAKQIEEEHIEDGKYVLKSSVDRALLAANGASPAYTTSSPDRIELPDVGFEEEYPITTTAPDIFFPDEDPGVDIEPDDVIIRPETIITNPTGNVVITIRPTDQQTPDMSSIKVKITREAIEDVLKLRALASKIYDAKREELKAKILGDTERLNAYFSEEKTYVTKTVGHILVSDMKTAQEVLDKFLSGNKTEEEFEALAKEYTEDSGVFYENVTKGQMVVAFENWIYDEARNAGDTGIVETDYGYHVMYFVGDGIEAWAAEALDRLLSEDLGAWNSEISESYTIKIMDEKIEKIFG